MPTRTQMAWFLSVLRSDLSHAFHIHIQMSLDDKVLNFNLIALAPAANDGA